MKLFAVGVGIGTKNSKGAWLDVFYPDVWCTEDHGGLRHLLRKLGYTSGKHVYVPDSSVLASELPPEYPSRDILLAAREKSVVVCCLDDDSAPASTPEAYLKLHMLSKRLVRPNEINLASIFKLLPNNAWTSEGPIDPSELPRRQAEARSNGRNLLVRSIDKFPPMTDYVIPSGVRIANAAGVRLGAYLGEGTTVMAAGFINFNAGCAGPNMIEGRISQGVFVGAGSDLGGGCSTMGTLSGGGEEVIRVGENCLIGANAGLGIPLGDGCSIEAGLYLTAGSKVHLVSGSDKPTAVVKARDLAHRDGLLFWRNSLTGTIECRERAQNVALNEDLHKHN